VLGDVLFGEITAGKGKVRRTIDIGGDAGTVPRGGSAVDRPNMSPVFSKTRQMRSGLPV
jgi:hypothetical protein